MAIELEITTQESIDVEVKPNVTELEITSNVTVVEVGVGIPNLMASSVLISPSGYLTTTNLQEALEQIAAQSFKEPTEPNSQYLDEGDTWYNTDTENLYVYRETSPGNFEWKPIIVGVNSTTSDTLDAGAF